MTWIDWLLMALAGGCFGASFPVVVMGCIEWFKNRREWKSDVRLRIRGTVNAALCAPLSSLALLLMQVVLFRQIMKSDSIDLQAGQPPERLAWIALAAWVGSATALIALGCWSGVLFFRQQAVRDEPVSDEGAMLSRIRRRFLIMYGSAGLLGMIAVVCGATIISA